MTDPVQPQRSSKRARLCSIENANRIATRVAEHVQGDTAVVKTGNPLQPFRGLGEQGGAGAHRLAGRHLQR